MGAGRQRVQRRPRTRRSSPFRVVRQNNHGRYLGDPGFATLTLPDVEGAIAEAEYALDTLHADGVILLADNHGRYLGDPGFAPLLAYLHSCQAIVFVHPGELPGDPVPGIPSFTADFMLDTTRAAISLVLSGTMKKYDGIKFILAHAGGFVPYIAYRIVLTMVSQENKARQLLLTKVDQEHEVKRLLDPLKQFCHDVATLLDPGGAAQPAPDSRAHPRALRQRLPLRPTCRSRLYGQPV